MSDERNYRDDKDGLSGLQDVSRRGFLQTAGLTLAAATATPVLAATESTAASSDQLNPQLGALFNPYHNRSDWRVLVRQRPEGMPTLGAYTSGRKGRIGTQINWAKQMGLQYFLASFCPDRPLEGIDILFASAQRAADFSVALYIDLEDKVGKEPHREPASVRLAAALEQVGSRYLSHPAYLRTGAGLPVLAVTGLDDRELLEETLAAAGRREELGPVLRLPTSWRWTPGAQTDRHLSRAIKHGLYSGFSAQPTKRPMGRAIPTHSQVAGAVLVTPVRNADGELELPPPVHGVYGPTYVILDSFNNWGVSVPLEPGTVSRRIYGAQVAAWSRSHAA